MKSLINYIKENLENRKYRMKSPKEMLEIFADDLNKVWDDPKLQGYQEPPKGAETHYRKEVFKNFWTNFSHNNITSGKHFKIFTPNINFRAGIQKNGFAKSLADFASSKVDTEGSARYLLCAQCDDQSYYFLCIDLLNYEWAGIYETYDRLIGYANKFKEDDNINDFGPKVLLTNHILKPNTKYMILTDEFYAK